ncbi:pentatricopeptide repeat-containing protein At4g01570-like [Arachis hypogaea]|uniref:pentatricopeptide repeat-containing protein At4g01570-like n=2 Tax=Arachis TaxID=3817 RepID=UPI003B21247E
MERKSSPASPSGSSALTPFHFLLLSSQQVAASSPLRHRVEPLCPPLSSPCIVVPCAVVVSSPVQPSSCRAPWQRNRASKKLGDILIVASITKALSESGGTRNLSPSLKLTHSIILNVLSNPSLHPSNKLHFFLWSRSHSSSPPPSVAAYTTLFCTLSHPAHLHHVPALLHSLNQDSLLLDSHSFKLLLNASILSFNFDLALQLLDYMQDLGSNLQPHIYSSVLVALIRKNQVPLALSIFFKLLDSTTDGFDSNTTNELLVSLRKASMKVEFKQVFDRLREKKGFYFDTWGYNICIYAFGCWGDLGASLTLFKEMKLKEKEKELLDYGSCGHTCSPVELDLCTYNSLISVLCKVGRVNDALKVFQELKEGSGHEPDEFTYRILVQGCSKTYRVHDATMIFNEMQNNRFRPDPVIYNSMLDGLFKARKVTEACQLFEKMVEEGTKASCWTYNILVDGLLKNGRPKAAYTLFCDLKKKGQFVDGVTDVRIFAITYSIIVLQFCRKGQLEEALQLVEEMESRGFVVDLTTITSLLISIHRHGRWVWTDRLMRHVRESDLVLSVLKWKVGMEASLKNPKSKRKNYSPMFPSKGDFSDVMSFITNAQDVTLDSQHDSDFQDKESSGNKFDEWSSSPHLDKLAKSLLSTSQLFTPSRAQRVQEKGPDSFDIDMVNTFLSIFLAKGKLSLACKLFEIFTDAGVDPVSYTFNSMMSSFVKRGYFTEALAILNQMGENLCPTDIATYNMIIQSLGKMGRADLTSAILDRLLKQGGYLDVDMYNTLINVLEKAGRIDEANNFFEQMKSSGINPDVVTYNTLIESHSKARRLKDAYKFLKMMLDAGCPPNHVTDMTLDYLGKEIDKMRYQKASILSLIDDAS